MNVFDETNVSFSTDELKTEQKIDGQMDISELDNAVENQMTETNDEASDSMDILESKTFDMGVDLAQNTINDGVASEYEFPEQIDRHEAYARRGRNQEYYRDPTYTSVRRNNENRGYFTENHERQSSGRYPWGEHPQSNQVPVYQRRKSRRYEVIGLIMKIVDLAGFELAERIVLRDKETGEILR